MHVLLRIACTMPVTSCECERSASSLRRLHTFTRTSMAHGRLSSLALIHIHYNTKVDFDEVVTIFSVKEPCRMLLTSILCAHRDACSEQNIWNILQAGLWYIRHTNRNVVQLQP